MNNKQILTSVINAVLNDMNIEPYRRKNIHKFYYDGELFTTAIPTELQGEFITLLYEELGKYNIEINCKCGIVLPIPHYQILEDEGIYLVCHICHLGYVNSSEIDQSNAVKTLLTRFKRIPSCIHLNSDVKTFKVCLPPGKVETIRSCSQCLPLFENDYILCQKCNLTVYTKFEHCDSKVYCSKECMLSDNVSI